MNFCIRKNVSLGYENTMQASEAFVQQRLSNRLLCPTSKKIFTTFEINLASGFGCSASVSPIAKGAERYSQC